MIKKLDFPLNIYIFYISFGRQLIYRNLRIFFHFFFFIFAVAYLLSNFQTMCYQYTACCHLFFVNIFFNQKMKVGQKNIVVCFLDFLFIILNSKLYIFFKNCEEYGKRSGWISIGLGNWTCQNTISFKGQPSSRPPPYLDVYEHLLLSFIAHIYV